MFFTGARDIELVGLTDGRFPATPRRRGSHPVFSLGRLPQNAGCAVCPCSSRRPYGRSEYLWIREGCTLLHTGYVMDRDSFIIKRLRFNIPAGIAYGLRFRGEVPDTCIESTGDRSRST
ncbi:MAG: hypothetical protein JRJ71_15835 [Deltaproteobacteria bacterium]|nr:hypothetical protein [Deltaproteobacteria bacterium]